MTTVNTFDLGLRCMTQPVSLRLAEDEAFAKFTSDSLARHQQGDWGDVGKEDWQANEEALAHGNLRLFSAYKHPTHPTIWIITEADRSATTILFPDDY